MATVLAIFAYNAVIVAGCVLLYCSLRVAAKYLPANEPFLPTFAVFLINLGNLALLTTAMFGLTAVVTDPFKTYWGVITITVPGVMIYLLAFGSGVTGGIKALFDELGRDLSSQEEADMLTTLILF